MSLLEGLNEHQQAAATHAGGPALVLAGAGSGKTRVLTTRVAWLMHEQGVMPEEIMLVTFTNKAAQEMNKRVASLTGYSLPYAGTFHRLTARILRKEGYRVGLAPHYSIYDTDDQLSLVKKVYKEHGLNPKEFTPQSMRGAISKAKNELLTPSDYEKAAKGHYQTFAAKVYKWYQHALQEQQAVDFDDLLMLTVKLLQNHPDVLSKYQQQLRHILVDEYQDTNRAQYLITTMLARPQEDVFVVGDFSQSIYAWRGADYRNMLNFQRDFPQHQEYRLERNYRSTQTILDAATQVIAQNTAHPVLELWTDQPHTAPIEVIEANSGDDEADQVVKEISGLMTEHQYQDIAILYRTNAQSRPFEEALVRRGIPYQVVGGFKFYERKEIKDALAYLRLVLNTTDTPSRERATKLGKRKLLVFDAWREQTYGQLNSEQLAQLAPYTVLKEILALIDYESTFDKHDPEELERWENVLELLNVASQFSDVATFLENIALVQDDYLADAETKQSRNVITLMSLHSAKGLEFPVVFMVGMEEGLLPHSRSLLEKEEMEEERRLCYVGITRAKEKLYFSYARRRWMYGSSEYSLRSRFLNEIEPSLLHTRASLHSTEYTGQPYGYRSFHKPATPIKKKPDHDTAVTRRLILDDDSLDAFLSGEMSADDFLK